MSKGFFEKNNARYVLQVRLEIDVPNKIFNCEVIYGLGYPVNPDKMLVLETGKFIPHTTLPLRILPTRLSLWENAARDIFSDKHKSVYLCNLSVIFKNQSRASHAQKLNMEINEENIAVDKAMQLWTHFKDHVQALIITRQARNTLNKTALNKPEDNQASLGCTIF